MGLLLIADGSHEPEFADHIGFIVQFNIHSFLTYIRGWVPVKLKAALQDGCSPGRIVKQPCVVYFPHEFRP